MVGSIPTLGSIFSMNIFVISDQPDECAMALDDRRLNKMVLETCQLLSTAMHLCGGKGPYKITHRNHPCSIWARQTKGNYRWLLQHFYYLTTEYYFRKGIQHACHEHFLTLRSGLNLIPDGPQTPFANCSRDKQGEIHSSYRRTMQEKWYEDYETTDKGHPRWTIRAAPIWYVGPKHEGNLDDVPMAPQDDSDRKS